MAIGYEANEWKDGESGGTPITAERLNRMEAGILAACEGVDGIDGTYGTVETVDDTGADVQLDVTVDGETLHGLPMTTACAGVAEGDGVIVETYGQLSIVTGVIAHDNRSALDSIAKPGDTMTAAGYYGGYITSGGTVLRFSIPCTYATDVSGASASDSWQAQGRADGGYAVGSSSGNASIDASSISITPRAYQHLDVAVTLSTAATAYNNHPVAVSVNSGTISFS